MFNKTMYVNINGEPGTRFRDALMAFTGAFMFSLVMVILVHEIGHFLAFHWKGYSPVIIRINPFMGATSYMKQVADEDAVFITLGGIFFDLLFAGFLAIILRRRMHPAWIPLKMYAVNAFLTEGLVIIAGLFFNQILTDFGLLAILGLSRIIIAILGGIFILIGGWLGYELWVLLGIGDKSSQLAALLINLPNFIYAACSFLLISAITIIDDASVLDFLIVYLVLTLIYLVVRILLIPVFMASARKSLKLKVPVIKGSTGVVLMVLGVASWFFSFIGLN